jgi:hypothetical protein
MSNVAGPKAGRVQQAVGGSVAALGLFLLGAALFTLVFMLLRWFRLGAVPDLSPLAGGFEPPITSLAGLNKLLGWLYRLQVAAPLICAGLALLVVGKWVRERKLTQRENK